MSINCTFKLYFLFEFVEIFREVCDLIITDDQANKKIGGPNLIVEVDEAHLHTRKNHVGRILVSQQIWIFGGVCRETKERFTCRVPDRSKRTLLPIMQRFIEKGGNYSYFIVLKVDI
jgi:hypothetical protein